MRNANRRADQRRAENSDIARPDTLLIFNSKNGSTRQYAEWLVKELDCDVIEYSRSRLGYASLYKNVIYGGWIRGSEITRLMMLKQNSARFHLDEKKLILFGVGISEPSERYRQFIRERNGIGALPDSDFHILPGRFDPKRLGAADRGTLNVMRSGMLEAVEGAEREILEDRLENGYDGVDVMKLRPLVEEIERSREFR